MLRRFSFGTLALIMGTACSDLPMQTDAAVDDLLAKSQGKESKSVVVGSVTGSGHITIAADTENEGFRTFTVSGRTRADGSVDGQSQFKNRFSGYQMHLEVTCINYLDNRAFVGGMIKQGVPPSPLAVGDLAGFYVEDNGQGNNASPDRLTGWIGALDEEFFGILCTDDPVDIFGDPDFWENSLTDIEGGNLRVASP